MGLDMYLYKKHYVKNWSHQTPEEETKLTVKKGGKKHPEINTDKVTYIQEEVGYWRKANAIHMWFVANVQGGVDECQESYVDQEKMRELLQTCIAVRDNSNLIPAKDGINKEGKIIEDPTFAKDFLPSQSGFFFGGTEYDEWYLKDIEDTIKILEDELKLDHHVEYYYRASW